jgi:RNA polymerase sigma-70 factor, ECF subfamily
MIVDRREVVNLTYDEKILLEKCRQGDVESFELLICDYQKKAFNIAYRILENIEDASDATQEAFIKVFKSIKDFKGESSFSTWLFRIVTNVSLDQLRVKKRNQVLYIDKEIVLEDDTITAEVADYSNMPEDVVDKKERISKIHKAINLLSEEHKTIIVLRDIQGFSYEEISQITNCSMGTVKSRINRARLSLKNILTSNEELLIEDYV